MPRLYSAPSRIDATPLLVFSTRADVGCVHFEAAHSAGHRPFDGRGQGCCRGYVHEGSRRAQRVLFPCTQRYPPNCARRSSPSCDSSQRQRRLTPHRRPLPAPPPTRAEEDLLQHAHEDPPPQRLRRRRPRILRPRSPPRQAQRRIRRPPPSPPRRRARARDRAVQPAALQRGDEGGARELDRGARGQGGPDARGPIWAGEGAQDGRSALLRRRGAQPAARGLVRAADDGARPSACSRPAPKSRGTS